jgi:hypothetical protein
MKQAAKREPWTRSHLTRTSLERALELYVLVWKSGEALAQEHTDEWAHFMRSHGAELFGLALAAMGRLGPANECEVARRALDDADATTPPEEAPKSEPPAPRLPALPRVAELPLSELEPPVAPKAAAPPQPHAADAPPATPPAVAIPSGIRAPRKGSTAEQMIELLKSGPKPYAALHAEAKDKGNLPSTLKLLLTKGLVERTAGDRFPGSTWWLAGTTPPAAHAPAAKARTARPSDPPPAPPPPYDVDAEVSDPTLDDIKAATDRALAARPPIPAWMKKPSKPPGAKP